MPRDRLDGLAMGLMLLLCATWGLQQISVKVAAAGVPPVLQAGLRSVGATALLWMWCIWRRVPLFDRDGSLAAGLVAGLLFAGEFVLLFVALDLTTAGRAVLFLYVAPFVVALGAHLFIPGERLSAGQALGLLSAFAGVALAFADGIGGAAGGSLVGDLLAVGAAVLWGATTVVVKASRLARIRASKTLFYQLAVSALVLPLLSLLLGEPAPGPLTPLVWGSVAFQIVIVAFASYLIWFWLVARYPAGRLSAFSFLTPLFGMAFGAVLLGERVTPLLGAALVLVAAGIWLVNRRPPQRTERSADLQVRTVPGGPAGPRSRP